MNAGQCRAALSKNARDVPYPNHANVVFVLQHEVTYTAERFWYDQFLDRIIVANSPVREWRDDDDTRVTVDLQERLGLIGLNSHVVSAAVIYVARQRTRHVIRDWLNALEWDGELRISTAFEDYWGAASNPYTQAASRNFLIGMVARILKPGCKLDTMPVFEGPEGIKKSTALEILGGEWYSTTHESIGTKDFLQGLRGKWLLEIAELSSFGKADLRAIRNTLSTRNDDYRKSHGHNVQRYPRECIFAGTSNPKDWANDEHGLRRFWPIECGELRPDLLIAAREQLFAEAVTAFRQRATWWEMPSVTASIQADRQQQDPWKEKILQWVDLNLNDDGVAVFDILTGPLKVPIDRVDRGQQMRVGRVLRLARMEQRKVRVGARTVWRWFRLDGTIGEDGTDGTRIF